MITPRFSHIDIYLLDSAILRTSSYRFVSLDLKTKTSRMTLRHVLISFDVKVFIKCVRLFNVIQSKNIIFKNTSLPKMKLLETIKRKILLK